MQRAAFQAALTTVERMTCTVYVAQEHVKSLASDITHCSACDAALA